jgi:hypothetical protein
MCMYPRSAYPTICVRYHDPMLSFQPHCKEDPIYVFQEMKLHGLVANSTFVYMWAIYIFPRSVHLFCCSKIGRQIADRQFHFWVYLFRIFGTVSQVLCSATFVNLSKLWQNIPSCAPVIWQWNYLHICTQLLVKVFSLFWYPIPHQPSSIFHKRVPIRKLEIDIVNIDLRRVAVLERHKSYLINES